MRRIAVITLPLALALATISHAQQQTPESPTRRPVEQTPAPPQRQYRGAYVALSHSTGTALNASSLSSTAEAVLVVPSQEMPDENLSELAADLDIMCAVLDQVLGDAGVKTSSWGPHVNRYRRSSRSLYLPGFGVLFLLEVEFPLASPPTTEPPTDEEATDAVWEEVRSGMRSQKTRSGSTAQPTAQYDELKVQSLKRTLQRAMKHCANLRHLDPDEQIVALAMEAPQARSTTTYLRMRGRYPISYQPWLASGAAGPAHIFAVKTTKKDVDALAGGQLSAADFQGRVKTLSYKLPPLETEPAPRRGR